MSLKLEQSSEQDSEKIKNLKRECESAYKAIVAEIQSTILGQYRSLPKGRSDRLRRVVSNLVEIDPRRLNFWHDISIFRNHIILASSDERFTLRPAHPEILHGLLVRGNTKLRDYFEERYGSGHTDAKNEEIHRLNTQLVQDLRSTFNEESDAATDTSSNAASLLTSSHENDGSTSSTAKTESRDMGESMSDLEATRENYINSYEAVVSATSEAILSRYRDLTATRMGSYHPKAMMLKRTVEDLQLLDYRLLPEKQKLKLVGPSARTHYFEMQTSNHAALYSSYIKWQQSLDAYVQSTLGDMPTLIHYRRRQAYFRQLSDIHNGEWAKLIRRVRKTFTPQESQALPEPITEPTPQEVPAANNEVDTALDRKPRVRGLGHLSADYNSKKPVAQKKEVREVKDTLLRRVMDLRDKYIEATPDKTSEPSPEAKALLDELVKEKRELIDFVFQMEGYEAARQMEKDFTKLLSSAQRERRLRRQLRWMYGGRNVAKAVSAILGPAAVTFAALTVAAGMSYAQKKLTSILGLSAGFVIYRWSKKYFLREFTKAEEAAQARGESFEEFQIENAELIESRKAAKAKAALLAAAGALAVAAFLNAIGANEYVASQISAAYEGSAAQSFIQSLTGYVSLQGVADFVRSSLGLEQSVGNPSVDADVSTSQSELPDSEQPRVSPVIEPPSNAPEWPTGIPMQPGSGDGFTQFLAGIQGSGTTPMWLNSIGGSPENWKSWAEAQGLMENGKSAILHASDTFMWAPDGSLLIDNGDGTFVTAINARGEVQKVLADRVKI